ncbi:hypothetical protein [Prevotella sp. E2-28]|uniref:hypothetical protein n=1 Tax=Prevotella sp. E2-28 TaxID=2913620 RepID=UPI001EDBC5FC|nr:hypothetical protein [Prevotella sp. E2-28]UKK55253.1 hypothetical protein L6465_14630 [Prevotella sp. E2-28]
MAIRKYTNPRELDLSTGLQEVLRKNGMQAHISLAKDGGRELIVLGHDSPVLTYKLNEKQVENLMGWGTTYENKKAYNTFASIVKDDFYMPQNFVSASNAFGRVAMGLHGYRIGHGEYGYDARPARRTPWFAPFSRQGRGWAGDFVGYAPRTEGFHLRRIGDHAYRPWGGGPMVTERPDNRVKPGEMLSGGYGFYFKGHQKETPVEVLDQISIEPKIKPLEAAPRPQGQGIPYSSVITSDVYFSNDKFQEVLKSHGIVIDEAKKTLTIQSNLSKVDLQYDLKPEELQKLMANKVSGKGGVSVDARLAIINEVIGKDFNSKLTKDMLETKELVSLDLKPEVRQEVEAPFIEQERRIAEQQRLAEARAEQRRESERIERDPNAIDGREIQAILGNKGWFQPVANGREMVVGEIRVDKTLNGTYVMEAEVNGRLLAHSISAKDYQKFLDLDDAHRLKMFDKVFNEVEIKSAHGESLYQNDLYLAHDGQSIVHQKEVDIQNATSNRVDGAALLEFNERKGFYRERAHGREVEVGNIQVDPTANGKYKMTAVINGQTISHEITQKQYDKFLAVDDYHRMQLFSKIFNEVDIKTRPGEGHNLGAALLAALVVGGEVMRDGLSVPHEPRPEIYETRTGPVYHKAGVVSPADVAAANFRSEEANLGVPGPDEGIRRGM